MPLCGARPGYTVVSERKPRGRSWHGTDKPAKPSREEMAAVKAEIWKAVEAGKITEEDARKRWEGYLKRFE